MVIYVVCMYSKIFDPWIAHVISVLYISPTVPSKVNTEDSIKVRRIMALTPGVMNKQMQTAVSNPLWDKTNEIRNKQKPILFKQKETLFSNECFQKLR